MSATIIKKLKEIPFSGQNIIEALDGQCKIVKYEDIHTYNTIDDLLKPYGKIAILYQVKPNYGHWCCLFLTGPDLKTLEFFDPYGMKIDEQLEFIKPEFRKQSNQDYPYLADLMMRSKYKLQYNDKKLQIRNNDVSTCGRHVCMRLILADSPLNVYQNFMTQGNGLNPDDKTTYLTAFI